ncbi:MAG: GTP cyclohydrolase, FolE2/MptA family [Candidatus Thorarchaeota archaeon]
MVIETQNEEPKHRIHLSKVGVKNLKTFVVTERSGMRHHIVPTVEITIDLPADLKGIHMSRLVESMTEELSDQFMVDFEFGYTTRTPVSDKRTWEVCDVTATTRKINKDPFIHEVEIKVIGNTVCPHCMANNDGLTHIQRAIGKLRVVGTTDAIPNYGSMIEIIESSFSSKTYSLLKLEDEMHVTKQMHNNPLLVEDVCRNILQLAKDDFSDRDLEMFAEARSLESIHKHDVIAQGRIVTNGE